MAEGAKAPGVGDLGADMFGDAKEDGGTLVGEEVDRGVGEGVGVKDE